MEAGEGQKKRAFTMLCLGKVTVGRLEKLEASRDEDKKSEPGRTSQMTLWDRR